VLTKEALFSKLPSGGATLQQLFLNAVAKFGDEKFLGTNTGSQYDYKSYAEVKGEAERLGSNALRLDFPMKVAYKNYK